MLTTKKTYRCPKCGEVFTVPEITGGIVFSEPQTCPKCGNACFSAGSLGTILGKVLGHLKPKE